MSATGSKIFRRNRAVGYVSNQVPSVVRYVQKRKDTIITTCIGRSFQAYTNSHFRLIHVSDAHPDDITCMARDRSHIYTASNKVIYAWRAGRIIVHQYKGHTKNVHLMMPFRRHLIAIDEANVLKVWDIKDETEYLDISFPKEDFLITAIAHPPTYINKIILGSHTGSLKLWNLKQNSLIYTFAGFGSKVMCIEPAPALDVVAIGHQSGRIVLLNLKFDEVLMEFGQDWGPVTQIAFRTDGPPIMATSSTNGNIVFWNLEEKKVDSQITAHEDTVTTMIALPNEPLLFTSSPDNSMKLWIFDQSGGGARLLRIREGHQAPPLCIRYHGSGGVNILSSGEDSSLRIFSTISESLNKSLGKASYNRKASKKKNRFQVDQYKMPPIIEFTTETTREKEWDNIAAIHSGIIQTTTWSFHKQKMGEIRFVPEKFQNKNRVDFKSETTCLTLTHCGNFVVVGYSNGDVERFNIQSGIHRASYGQPAHKAAVRGVACDNLNQFVASGCSDGILKFWPFKENVTTPMRVLNMPSGIDFIRSHSESALLCVVLDSFAVCVVDSDTKTIIRKFEGHSAKVTDATFSPDSRWLITSGMDAVIKVWDIPSSYMIDHFKVERPCLSLTMSPTGDFLATAHVNCLGIYLWANKTLFSHISLRSINPQAEPPYIDLPSNVRDEISLETAVEELDMNGDDDEEEGEEIELNYETPRQLSDELITMSGLAESRWQNLLDLDIIKKRNKPKAPLKVPKQAPFFLPTVAGTEFKFDLSGATKDDDTSRVLSQTNFNNLSSFGKLLEKSSETGEFQECVDYLKKLGPSMIDFEVKSLHPIGGGTYKSMTQFVKMITYMLSTNADFELSQAYLSVFLRSHGVALVERPDIVRALKEVEVAQKKSWDLLEQKLLYSLGVVSALRNYVN